MVKIGDKAIALRAFRSDNVFGPLIEVGEVYTVVEASSSDSSPFLCIAVADRKNRVFRLYQKDWGSWFQLVPATPKRNLPNWW